MDDQVGKEPQGDWTKKTRRISSCCLSRCCGSFSMVVVVVGVVASYYL